MKYFVTLLILILAPVFTQAVSASQKLVLGVYQYQSIESVQNQYQALADYLSDTLPNHQVELKVYSSEALIEAARRKQVDLVLTNPNSFEILRTEVLLNGITATQQTLFNNQALDSLGGVIFTRNNASTIQTLNDLPGKNIAIPTLNNTGAYRVPIYEIFKQGIDYKQIHFNEMGNNDAVIEAVLSNKADAGFVRTGIIEKWVAAGKLKLDQLRIINQKTDRAFPQLLSTSLYPEWPFIILPGLDDDLKRDITVALFSLKADSPAAKQAGIAGFVAPLDYKPLEDLLRELKLPPYDIQDKITFEELWQQYHLLIIGITIAILIFIILLTVSHKRLRTIQRQQHTLNRQNQIDEVLLTLPKFAEEHTEPDLMQYAMERIEELTDSEISFIHFIDEAKQEINLVAWSHNTLKNYCHVANYDSHYPISEAGVWAEAARQKKVVMINDYVTYQHKQGLPEGHAPLNRMISLPVLEKDQVVLLAGIGNKKSDYSQQDSDTCQLICNELWHLIKERRSLHKIESQKTQFERLLDDLGNNHLVYSHNGAEGILNYVSAGVVDIFEISIDEILHRPWFEKINWLPSSIQEGKKSVEKIITGEEPNNSLVLHFITPKSQQLKTILIQQHGVHQEGELISIDGLVTDITQQVASEKHLKQAATVFESANEGILICDKNNQILRANKRVTEITGYQEEELLGKDPNIFNSGQQDDDFYKSLWNSLSTQGIWEGEIWNRRKNGDVYPQSLKISTVFDSQNQPEYYIALLSDITYEKEHQLQLEKMAHYDALTELPNRFLLSDRITQAIANIQRSEEMIALMFIDLDGFKQINDNYGHQAGDFLLKTIANRFLDTIRESDTVSRIGGDEFVILVTGNKYQHEFQGIEARLLANASDEVSYENHSLQVSCSIGVVYYNHNYPDKIGSEQLLRYADQTMYEAKQQGKNRVVHYEWNNLDGKQELLSAMLNKEFELYYQPKVNCKTGQTLSLEGLIRWIHPQHGLIPPIDFLNKIQQFDLMDTFSEYVLEQGVQSLKKINAKGYQLGVSLNIEGSILLNQSFRNKLLQLFADNPDVLPEQLTLELLESSALEDVHKIARQITQLQTEGFKFAIDDFGTGHASLNYLKNLPVDEVKIDQEFIREIFSETNSLSIIEAIKSMAEAFNLTVVAEGAETEKHIELLLQLGIESIQGYAIAKPMNQEQVFEWLNNPNINPKWQTIIEINGLEKRILKAQLAHSAWIDRIESVVTGNLDIESINDLSHTQCEFGLWLHSKGSQIIKNKSVFEQINILHQEIHSIAHQAIQSLELDDKAEAQRVLAVLKGKSVAFCDYLRDSTLQK
ncbi:hypothetical protein THMIRHAM_00730 [Thiomicrorhabdus immobilis]|uniref:EAL domain-containing protein n=1 Tax=Thiomicrorhabdus immobilis TaxID=2791037 RepID=A0ABN6CTL3_9GAMM|nr:EAL domain-containing protein [Thiomicrorhabdus immobilis]BCN92288.1 hypothetical protein THMIRHAM_00730 [Thiomicrorhabdus immobilis]